MEEPTLKSKIQHLVYKISLPIYLWSIGYKTLDEYQNEIIAQDKREKDLIKEIFKPAPTGNSL